MAMATTRDYIRYLNDEVDIAPANTQEELQAAEAIEQLMGQHDVDLRMQEFDTPAWAGLSYRVLMIVLFVSTFLAGMQGSPASIIGIVLSLVSLALFVARYLGYDLIGSLGPRARSQNVIAIHRATGPLADKANRPIVVVAHYDTPRDNFLYGQQLAVARPLIGRFSPYLVLGCGVCSLFQALVFIPDAARLAVWILGIVCALPLAALGISTVVEQFAPFTDGANDNKAGVAALLGVLATVSPATDAAEGMANREEEFAAQPFPAEEDSNNDPAVAKPVIVRRYEEVVGVRHGKETLTELHILPNSCEIVYQAPQLISEVVSDPITVINSASTSSNEDYEDNDAESYEDEPMGMTGELMARGASVVAGVTERGRALFGKLSSRFARDEDNQLEPLDDNYDDAGSYPDEYEVNSSEGFESDAEVTAPVAEVVSNTSSAAITNEMTVADGITFSQEHDPSDSEIATRDDSGLGVMVDVYDHNAPRNAKQRSARPAEPEGRNWGANDLGPSTTGGFARRAVLFDLPDPSSASNDPFATSTNNEPALDLSQASDDAANMALNTSSAPAPIPLSADLQVLRTDDDWKGGAASREGLRGADDAHEELREAMRETVLGMNDDALIAHDIWFVALGANGLGHAGMKAFIDEYRREIRGAFVLNLNCVGAGTPTIFMSEGIDNSRRADRRLTRLIASVADDLHLNLDRRPLDWDTRDATIAMRRSMRAVTIEGVDESGVPALSHTADDVLENIDEGQVTRISELVCEIIRRS